MFANRKVIYLTVALLLALMFVAIPAGSTLAQTGAPVSGDGVQPIEVAGNPSCQSLGYGFGFKIQSNYNRTFNLTSANGELTNGAPSDPFNTITVSSADNVYFNWSSTLFMDAVIVKGGDAANAYVYIPEDNADTGLASPVNSSGNPAGISHIEFCYDYDLTATKTANAQYKRTYTWTIDKSVTPDTHSGFPGDTFSSDYSVALVRSQTDSDFAVSGNIIVTNPTPFTVNFGVTDSVGGIAATVSCPAYTLAPGANTTCTYSASLGAKADGTNTATITSSTPAVNGTTASANYAFGAPTTIAGFPTVNVTDSVKGTLGSASGSMTIPYSGNFACPVDASLYVNGLYTFEVPNTATIVETGQNDSAKVTIKCYAPVVSKTAAGLFDKRFTWHVKKWVVPASQSGVVGEKLSWIWWIDVWPTSALENFRVAGTISIKNPADKPMTVNVADVLSDSTVAAVDCGGLTTLTIPAGQTGQCTYLAKPTGQTATENTATAKINNVSFSGKAAVGWSLDQVFNPTASVVDPTAGLNTIVTTAIPDHLFEFGFPGSHTCSTNPGDYNTEGSYTGSLTNTVSVTGSSGQSTSATSTTNWTCYAPVVTKTASATYDETHTWTLAKSVNPTSQWGYPGDKLNWTWKVDVSETSADSKFAVTGKIFVKNPAGKPMTVAVTDKLNDNTVAVVNCGGGATSLTIPAGQTGECAYTAAPTGKTATLNTATATIATANFSGSAAVNFIKNVINGSATLTDPLLGLNEKLQAGSGPWSFTGPGSHTCSSKFTDYGMGGVYSNTVTNTATLTLENGASGSLSVDTTYTCKAGTIDLLKLTNGLPDPAMQWNFALYLGPDGFGKTLIASDSTPPALMDFGLPALRPDKTYTVCEKDVMAGWSSQWKIGDTILQVYNPNADENPPVDVGNRCFDFKVGDGETIHFVVDNSKPGGDPRTPGYWKNWSSCTGGGQYVKTIAANDPNNDFISLDEVLNWPGITWDDNLVDTKLVFITDCKQAVSILDQRVVVANSTSGKKLASDAARTLAMHLLAAQLNFGAGACTTPEVLTKALAAELLLDKLDFDGTKSTAYLSSKSADYAYALSLAKYLDEYNNGKYCGSLMP